jgi:hypothetical protein
MRLLETVYRTKPNLFAPGKLVTPTLDKKIRPDFGNVCCRGEALTQGAVRGVGSSHLYLLDCQNSILAFHGFLVKVIYSLRLYPAVNF